MFPLHGGDNQKVCCFSSDNTLADFLLQWRFFRNGDSWDIQNLLEGSFLSVDGPLDDAPSIICTTEQQCLWDVKPDEDDTTFYK